MRLFQSPVCSQLYRFAATGILTRCSNGPHGSQRSSSTFQSHRRRIGMIAAAVGAGAAVGLWTHLQLSVDASTPDDFASVSASYGNRHEGLPTYSMNEIAEHNSLEKRVWVSYKYGVYDVTDFVGEHPGGDKIMLGAGSSVEPFWSLYAVHKNPHVLQILEKYRIGNLKDEEVGSFMAGVEDPYANEPNRHSILKPSSVQPFNAEPPLELLAENLVTPSEFFFVRNHLPVPIVDESTYELEIEGVGLAPMTLSLDDVKKLPKHSITSVIQCGGNRRSEMIKVKPVKGLTWGPAAIGNAVWSGAKLCDLLRSCGLDEATTTARHVQLEGLDTDPTGQPFGASIPIEKAMDPRGDVILAYEMNGEPLSRDHGFPLRLVVPGVVGARNVKWLGRIVVSEDESDSHWQQNDYKSFAPNIDWDTVDFSKSPAIQEMPVTSAICVPQEGQTVKLNQNGTLTIKGYAYSGGGRKVIRVDVSADGGRTWQAAEKLESDYSRHPRAWGWTLFEATIPVKASVHTAQLCCKAVDSQHNTQPESFRNIWNLRGVVGNAYHRVNVKICM